MTINFRMELVLKLTNSQERDILTFVIFLMEIHKGNTAQVFLLGG